MAAPGAPVPDSRPTRPKVRTASEKTPLAARLARFNDPRSLCRQPRPRPSMRLLGQQDCLLIPYTRCWRKAVMSPLCNSKVSPPWRFPGGGNEGRKGLTVAERDRLAVVLAVAERRLSQQETSVPRAELEAGEASSEAVPGAGAAGLASGHCGKVPNNALGRWCGGRRCRRSGALRGLRADAGGEEAGRGAPTVGVARDAAEVDDG